MTVPLNISDVSFRPQQGSRTCACIAKFVQDVRGERTTRRRLGFVPGVGRNKGGNTWANRVHSVRVVYERYFAALLRRDDYQRVTLFCQIHGRPVPRTPQSRQVLAVSQRQDRANANNVISFNERGASVCRRNLSEDRFKYFRRYLSSEWHSAPHEFSHGVSAPDVNWRAAAGCGQREGRGCDSLKSSTKCASPAGPPQRYLQPVERVAQLWLKQNNEDERGHKRLTRARPTMCWANRFGPTRSRRLRAPAFRT